MDRNQHQEMVPLELPIRVYELDNSISTHQIVFVTLKYLKL